MHGLDPRQYSLRCPKRFEPQYEAYHLFDSLLILFNNIIEIAHPAPLNASLLPLVRALDRNGVGPGRMDANLLGDTVTADGLL